MKKNLLLTIFTIFVILFGLYCAGCGDDAIAGFQGNTGPTGPTGPTGLADIGSLKVNVPLPTGTTTSDFTVTITKRPDLIITSEVPQASAAGSYTFNNLIVGLYLVTLEGKGYVTQTSDNVEIKANEQKVIDFTMPEKVQILYGVSNGDVFYTINPTNGQATTIGPIGFDSISAIATHPTTGVIYGTGYDDGTAILLTIDPNTGAGTWLADLTQNIRIPDMDFRPSDNTLFAVDNDEYLYTIALNGTVTDIGPTVTDHGGNGLAFSSLNVLYFAGDNTFYTLDQDLGTGAVIDDFNPSTDQMSSMKFNPITGVLFGTTMDWNDDEISALLTIDPTTGAVTYIGATAYEMQGICWSR